VVFTTDSEENFCFAEPVVFWMIRVESCIFLGEAATRLRLLWIGRETEETDLGKEGDITSEKVPVFTYFSSSGIEIKKLS